jgi:ubiquinone/menaquinone biosynthesis C-methylase UbiE
MQRLADTPELMDGPLDATVLAGNLRDLVRVNRWLGGTRLSERALSRLLAGGAAKLTMLDVGTGAADIPASLIERFAGQGTTLIVHAVDERQEMVTAARARVGERADLTLEVTAGGERLPYPDDAFDIVHCSLVLHHLEPGEAVGLLRECARVGRCGVVVNDLDRAAHLWLGAWLLGHLLTGNRYTRHDAPLSVRRAHRPAEVERMASEAGLELVARVGGFMGHRYALVLARTGAAPDGDG